VLAWIEVLSLVNGKMHAFVDSDNRLPVPENLHVSVLPSHDFHLPRFDIIVGLIEEYAFTGEIVGFINNDCWPGERTVKLLHHLQRFHMNAVVLSIDDERDEFVHTGVQNSCWLAIAARYDIEGNGEVNLHPKGGTDLWLWNSMCGSKVVDGGLLGELQKIPSFYIARPHFDMWLIWASLRTGYRHVIDISEAITIMHPDHERKIMSWDDNTRQKLRDEAWNHNFKAAFAPFCVEEKCFLYTGGKGTPCEAPFYLNHELTMKQRDRPVSFVCLTAPEGPTPRIDCTGKILGRLPLKGTFDYPACQSHPKARTS